MTVTLSNIHRLMWRVPILYPGNWPPFKSGPIPASEYRDGAWRDAAFTVWRSDRATPFGYPFKRERVPP